MNGKDIGNCATPLQTQISEKLRKNKKWDFYKALRTLCKVFQFENQLMSH